MADSKTSKAALRSLMKIAATKREKKIDSPLVRYNEFGQAICKVCNTSIKSEALWSVHLASKAHKEASNLLKARIRSMPPSEQQQAPPQPIADIPVRSEAEEAVAQNGGSTRAASVLPSNFFDAPPPNKSAKIESNESTATPSSSRKSSTEGTPVNSSVLPEGFFDNKEADNKARGIAVPKVNVVDEMKEFEKSVKEELTVAESRQDEEDEEVANAREEEELLNQKLLQDRVEVLRKKKEEHVDAIAKARNEGLSAVAGNSDKEEEEDEGEETDDEILGIGLMNWRSKNF